MTVEQTSELAPLAVHLPDQRTVPAARSGPDVLDPTLPSWARSAHRLAWSSWFQNLVIGVIVFNAIVIGLETYESMTSRWDSQLEVINDVLLGFFVVELTLRLASVAFRPRRFLRHGWNVFDLLVVAAAFVPGLAANSTTLRLVRLLRVTRLLRLMPDARVLLDGLKRALPPSMSLVGLTVLLCYVYGVVGWSLFHEALPERWGTIGESMLTLFELLTLEGWNEIMHEARDVSPWGLPFVISFVLVGTFIVINLVIGVVITSLDEAYKEQRHEREGETLATSIDSVRAALDQLERDLAAGSPHVGERMHALAAPEHD